MSSSCNCGSDCKCGTDCKCGSSMYPDLENTTTETLIAGFGPVKTGYSEGSEYGAENGCKCGSNCSCDSCGCGK